jgi:SnoaL-like domain
VNTQAAARRWAETWRDNWVARNGEPIVALYAEGARYSTAPFRDARIGPEGAREYVLPVLAEEAEVKAWFAEPIVDGDRASVSWWASFLEDGIEATYAGTSVLRFNDQGLVVDEWDAWNRADGRLEPPPGWGRSSEQR